MSLSQRQERWLAAGLVATLTALGFWLRLVDLERADIWWDEGWTAFLARLSPVEVVSLVAAVDLHPPLQYWLFGAWRLLAGDDPWALRFLSVAVGTATIPLVASIAVRLAGSWAGVAAAALLAVARFHVWWSQEIRGYALSVLLASLLMVCWLRLMTGDLRRGWVAGLALATGLGMLTNYLLVVVPAGLGLVGLLWWLAAPRRRWRAWRCQLLAWVAALVAYLPWLWVFVTTAHQWDGEPPVSWELFSQLWLVVVPLGISVDVAAWYLPAALAWLVAASGVLVLLTGRGNRRWVALAFVLVVVGAPLLLFAATQLPSAVFQPKLGARYLLLFVPFFILLCAVALAWLARRLPLLAGAGLALLVAIQLPGLGTYYLSRQPASEAAAAGQYLQAMVRDGEAVVLLPGQEWPVWRYWAPWPQRWITIAPQERLDAARAQFLLAAVPAETSGAWLVTTREAASADPSGSAAAFLTAVYGPPAIEQRFGQTTLRLYSPDRERRAELQRRDGAARGAPAGVVRGAPPLLRPGDRIPLPVYTGPLSQPTMVRSILSGPGGELAGRSFTVPAGADGLAPLVLAIPASAQAGTYRLWVEIGERRLDLGATRIAPATASAPAPPVTPLGVSFEQGIELVGYDVAAPAAASSTPLELTLHWRALAPIELSYTVFVHVLDASGRRVAQRDRLPLDGRNPTDLWEPGDVVVDDYRLALPRDLPPQPLTVQVGWYLPATGARLAILDAAGIPTGTSVTLGPITAR